VLHLTDLTSYKDGQRVEPNSRADSDESHPIEELNVTIGTAVNPGAVHVVPASTAISWRWADGKLSLAVHHFQVHAAVLMDMTAPASWPLMPSPEIH
jgi:hypothetical protein